MLKVQESVGCFIGGRILKIAKHTKNINTVDVIRVKSRGAKPAKPTDDRGISESQYEAEYTSTALKKLNPDVDTINVKLGMRLTSYEVPTLSEELKKEIDDGVARIIFDMAETVTIDSKGITFLIAMSDKMSAVQEGMHLVNVSPGILDLFNRMQLVNRLYATGCRNS